MSASDSIGGATLVYSAQGLPPGLSINPSTGAITGTIAVGASGAGSYSPTIVVSDGTYASSASFNWTVNSPITITDPGDQANVVGDTITLGISATDATMGTLTYAATGLPMGVAIDTSTGAITGTVVSSAAYIGSFTTTITVSDGTYSASDTFSWTVVASGSVTMTTPSNQTNTEGDTVSLSLSASGSGRLKYFAVGLPEGLKINPSTGAITGTVGLDDGAEGEYAVTVVASNGTSSAVENFTWTVTSPVTIDPITDHSYTEGGSVSLSPTANDSSAGTMKFSATGLPAGLTINTGSGAITGTVALGDAAGSSYAVTVIAADGTFSGTQTFTITVGSPITLTQPADQTNVEGGTVSLTISATDASMGTLSYSASGLPGGLKINPSTGAITGTVAPGDSTVGEYSVTVTASDGTYSASQTFAWTINNPITISPVAIQRLALGQSFNRSIQATDSSGGTLKFVALGLVNNTSINPSTGIGSGSPAASSDSVGVSQVPVLVVDGTYTLFETVTVETEATSFGLPSATLFESDTEEDEQTVPKLELNQKIAPQPIVSPLGPYLWPVAFNLNKPGNTDGWIIQQITTSRKAYKGKTDVSDKLFDPKSNVSFWEAWPVAKGQVARLLGPTANLRPCRKSKGNSFSTRLGSLQGDMAHSAFLTTLTVSKH